MYSIMLSAGADAAEALQLTMQFSKNISSSCTFLRFYVGRQKFHALNSRRVDDKLCPAASSFSVAVSALTAN